MKLIGLGIFRQRNGESRLCLTFRARLYLNIRPLLYKDSRLVLLVSLGAVAKLSRKVGSKRPIMCWQSVVVVRRNLLTMMQLNCLGRRWLKCSDSDRMAVRMTLVLVLLRLFTIKLIAELGWTVSNILCARRRTLLWRVMNRIW